MTTIITALIFGSCAVAALLIMRHDHRAERRARQEAIDEATAPWRALYAEREAALRELREEHERTVAALRRELRRADQEIAHATGMRLREVMRIRREWIDLRAPAAACEEKPEYSADFMAFWKSHPMGKRDRTVLHSGNKKAFWRK